jgi:hypothetical protein
LRRRKEDENWCQMLCPDSKTLGNERREIVAGLRSTVASLHRRQRGVW